MIHAVKILTMGLAQMVLQVPGLLSKYQVIVLVVVPPLREDFAKYVHTVCIGRDWVDSAGPFSTDPNTVHCWDILIFSENAPYTCMYDANISSLVETAHVEQKNPYLHSN